MHPSINKSSTLCAVLALTLSFSTFATGNNEERAIDFLEQQKINSYLILNMFMNNVAQGKVEIFGTVLTPNVLEARYLAYLHHFKDESVSVCIHFGLKVDIDVPNIDQYIVDEISVEFDENGNIEYIRTIVKPKTD